MKLIKYLRDNFSSGISESLVSHFMEEFGVKVKVKDNLALFKYDQLAVKWTNPIAFECRGTIMAFENNDWEIVSRPFDKFFNMHEFYCTFDENNFKNNRREYDIVEKLDGSCIQMYYWKNEWHVTTLGTLDTTPINAGDITFKELFLNLFSLSRMDMTDYLHIDYTYMFELCSWKNRIVTRYKQDKVVLLGARNKHTGTYLSMDYMKQVYKSRGFYFPHSADVNSIDDIAKFVEKKESYNDIDCEYPEGFVIYHNNIPVAKVKNHNYLTLHHMIGAGEDKMCSYRRLTRAFFEGNIDDIIDALNKEQFDYIENLKDRFREYMANMRINSMAIKDAMEVTGDDKEDKKRYALAVQKLSASEDSAFFYQNKEMVLTGEFDYDILEAWLRKNLDKNNFLDRWIGEKNNACN